MNKNFTKEVFSNQNEVRWCPGCGDYAILSALQKTFAELGLSPEEHVIVSGIGCSGRLPYYMNTYGFHTIHGRAPAVATGLKLMRPELTVWLITGDGDALSIGSNHIMHLLRRNINVNVLLFNNQVYGLTKGQFSPTSHLGQITKTSPSGVFQRPVNPIQFALGCGASFVARSIDKDPVHMSEVFQAAYAHNGCAFVEIYQDCHVFNPGAFDDFSTKTQRQDGVLYLNSGKPMTFSLDSKVLCLDDGRFKVSHLIEQATLHQPDDYQNATRLARLNFPDFPVPVGIIYQEQANEYTISKNTPRGVEDLVDLFKKGAYWSRF
jgi:2-oxoglutarate ferredoxin oxidoreductase subunit beta